MSESEDQLKNADIGHVSKAVMAMPGDSTKNVNIRFISKEETHAEAEHTKSLSKEMMAKQKDFPGNADVIVVSKEIMVENEDFLKKTSVRSVPKKVITDSEDSSVNGTVRSLQKQRRSDKEFTLNSASRRPLSVGMLAESGTDISLRMGSESGRSCNSASHRPLSMIVVAGNEGSANSACSRSVSIGVVAGNEGSANSTSCRSVSIGVVAEARCSAPRPVGRTRGEDGGTVESGPVPDVTADVPGRDSLTRIDMVSEQEKAEQMESENEDDRPFSDQYSDQEYYDSQSEGGLSDTEGVGAEGTDPDYVSERDSWSSNTDYLVCCLGFVCGLSNILQFPCLAAKYGGATFCLAYSLVVFLCGLPMVYLETAIGQFSGHGPAKAWTIIPLFSGLGFAMVLISVLISIYHSIYITWILYYLGLTLSPGFSGTNSSAILLHNRQTNISGIPTAVENSYGSTGRQTYRYSLHSSHSASVFHDQVLSLSEGAHSLGDVQPLLVACLILTWLTVFLLLASGTRIIPKVLYIFMPLPIILVISLLVKSSMIEGAVEGIRFYLTPKWSKLVQPEMWWDVGRQVFFSLGLGTGALTSLSSHSNFHTNCHRNSLVIVLGNVLSSVFTGFLIFSLLGAISHKQNTSLDQVITYDTDVSFLLLLEVMGQGPWVAVWAGIFFLLLSLVGLSRQCFLVHNIVTSVRETITGSAGCSKQGQITPTAFSCILLCLPALALTTQGGMFVARLLHVYVCKWAMFFLCLCECVTVMWVYGGQRFLGCVTQMSRREDNMWWRAMWSVVTPLICLVMLCLTWWGHDPLRYSDYHYPASLEAIGWFISCLPIAAITLGVVLRCALTPGAFRQRVDFLTQTPVDWGRGCSGNGGDANIPEYIACSPEDPLKAPVIPPDVTSGLLWNMFALTSVAEVKVPQIYQHNQAMDVAPSGGFLSDMVDIDGYSVDSDSTGDENKERGNWAGKLEFIMSGLGYVVGLGNVWRFPYLVYRNGGGAFFIPYLTMLLFCGIPLVFMELSFGQYASLGPISIWKAVPLLKGVGMSMVIISALVGIYYNMVVAWALLYLFSSLTQTLPWLTCDNPWNTIWCNENVLTPANCSQSGIKPVNSSTVPPYNLTSVTGLDSQPGESTLNDSNPFCSNSTLYNNSLAVLHQKGQRYNIPSEEYFYLSILNISEDIGVFGEIQWKLALCLLLAWVLIFVCLVKGIKSSGKVMYLIVGLPYLSILVLMIQNMTMEGYLDGIEYYLTPKWSLLRDARVWSDAAAQVFFSLSVCWGGLSTLASYNRFQNNIYRDAIIICLGDTLMSVLAGFSVFSMIGVLGKQLNTTVDNVIQSDIGLAFIAYPETISRFPISPLWSVLFFLMLSMVGLSTQVTTVETIVTAVIDEHTALLKKRRVWMLLLLCSVLYLLGLPLTTQGGLYWLQLMDEYLAGWSVMVLGIIMCLGLGYLYGINKFCMHLRQMIGETPRLWWKAMWCVVCPLVIVFILVFAVVDYAPAKFGSRIFPDWAQAIGFCLTIFPLLPIPIYMVYRLATEQGTCLQRLKSSYKSDKDWGPALEKFWDVQYMPTVSTLLHRPLHDMGISSVETVTDRVDFTTVGVRTACLSESSLLTGSTNLNSPISRKHFDSIRQRAILQHAYSNPQCNTSLYNSSSEKLPVSRQDSCNSNTDYIIVPRKKRVVEMCDKSTQTSRSSLVSQSLKNVSGEVVKDSADIQMYRYPVHVEVEVTKM